MLGVKTCYMCDKPKTSREHAPPLSFFPTDRRTNLITVPSCDSHNSEKSKDDEYLRFVIALSYDTNEQGHKVVFKKVLRGLKLTPHLFQDFLLHGSLYPVMVNGKPSMGFTINFPRFVRALDHMARAIFFYHFKEQWGEKLDVKPVSGAFSPDQANYKQQNARLLDLKHRPFGTPRHGQNKDIFYYQFLNDEPPSRSVLKMVFYGGFTVLAYPMSRARGGKD